MEGDEDETMGLLSGAAGALVMMEERVGSGDVARPSFSLTRSRPSSAASRIKSLWNRRRQRNSSGSTDVSDDQESESQTGVAARRPPGDPGGGGVGEGGGGEERGEEAGERAEWGGLSPRRPLSPAFSSTRAPSDFQVAISLIEARLTGPNFDSVVCIQVGDQKKYSAEKAGTHCPYFNEYFVFDFRMAASSFMDQLIVLTVYQSRKILRPTEVFGSFKLDVATVYSQRDKQFHHKWAVLMDPEDMSTGAKGYLKVSISVVGKGERVRAPLKPEKESDEDDVEANLLLPAGVSGTRQQARYIFRIYSAQGLPVSSEGVMAKARKALRGESGPETSDYAVHVSFAGHQGSTRREKGSHQVAWNEELIFVEMFPPLVRRVRLQVRRADALSSLNLATHFLDFTDISDEGRGGFVPTFGPALLQLYGSAVEGGFLERSSPLNEGLGEGVAYRGCLLLSLRVEVIDGPPVLVPGLGVEPALPVPLTALGPKSEFLLFGCIMDVTMLDKRLVGKPVHLEVSMGCVGDGGEDAGEELGGTDWGSLTLTPPSPVLSSTMPLKAQLDDEHYSHLPFGDSKPCVYLAFRHVDLRWRLFHANHLAALAHLLRDALAPLASAPPSTHPLHSVLDLFLSHA